MVKVLCVLTLLGVLAPMTMAAPVSNSWIADVDALYADRENLAKVESSVETLRKVIAQQPNSWEAYWRLARSLRWIAEFKEKDRLPVLTEAKQMAEKAVAINPNSAETQYWLAACTGRWGEERGILQSLFAVKTMKAALDKVVELEPKCARAHYVLSQLYRKVPGWPISIGNKKQSLVEANLAVQLDGSNTTFRFELAEAQLANGLKAEAKVTLQKVISMPLTPGEAFESREDKKKATEMLAKIK